MREKTNQHYVWQKYLEPWTESGQIWCLRDNRLFQTATRNIASQRFFYSLKSINKEDMRLIRKMLVGPSPPSIIPLCNTWIDQIEKATVLMTIFHKAGLCKGEDKEVFLRNVYEELHCAVENTGNTGLNMLRDNKTSFLLETADNKTEGMDFLIYLAFQYLRTKRMKENVKKALADDAPFSSIDNCMNLMVPILATKLAYSLNCAILDEKLRCTILINHTDIEFITGDQPVINTKAHLQSDDITKAMELYYPLTPTKALIIATGKITEDISVDEAYRYNELIKNHSLELILAKNQGLLHKYRK